MSLNIPISEFRMSLGTKNRQIQTAELCKHHLREKNAPKAPLVEEFIEEIEGMGKERNIASWGQFADVRGNDEEMLKRVDQAFADWLNPDFK